MFNPYGEKTGREPQWKKSIELQRDDAKLRKIAEKNFEKKFSVERKPRPDLIDNFHWVITRFRRMKKITQEQLAKEIFEPVTAIQMAEQGIVPEKDYILVRKIENYLGITLIKEEKAREKEKSEQQDKNDSAKKLTFEPHSSKNLTIADLRRIREESSSMRSQAREERMNPSRHGQINEEKGFSEFAVDFEEESEEKSEEDFGEDEENGK